MMQAAVSETKASLGPILINPDPETRQAGEKNLFAFSDEVRQKDKKRSSSLLRITEVPRLRQCYGWTKFTGKELRSLVPRELWPPTIHVNRKLSRRFEDEVYFAIVYEFVEEGGNEPDVVQSVLDLFWRTGFSNAPITLARNWKSGVLVDLSDVVDPFGYGWLKIKYRHRKPEDVLSYPER